MSFTDSENKIIETGINSFFECCRPSEKIRDEYDIGYKIENQSVILFEIRPSFQNDKTKIYPTIAKTRYLRSQNLWKIYWERSDMKWHSYDPKPSVKSFKAFLKIVMEDKFHCFFG